MKHILRIVTNYHKEDTHEIKGRRTYYEMKCNTLMDAIKTLSNRLWGAIMFDYDKNGDRIPIIHASINGIDIPITTPNIRKLEKEIIEMFGNEENFISEGEMIL